MNLITGHIAVLLVGALPFSIGAILPLSPFAFLAVHQMIAYSIEHFPLLFYIFFDSMLLTDRNLNTACRAKLGKAGRAVAQRRS